jgi:hypothetical protein
MQDHEWPKDPPVGVVSIRKDQLVRDIEHLTAARHGYLWVYIAPATGKMVFPGQGYMRWYRSLATGKEEVWFDNEVERADADADTEG